ncbi:hypothetical protein [Methylobacterium sp. ID0610]|uniref:hypothetical protein n=1 Tax=Methylobacterium carpenticola TaxID=3344827 RepID=UPI003694BCEF
MSGANDAATEITTHRGFEEKWNWLQAIIQGLIGLAIAAGLAGMFGDGPLAHARQPVPGTPLVLRYERFMRAGAPARLTVVLTQPLAQDQVEVGLDADFLEHVSVDATQPRAEAVDATPAGVTYRFRLGPERQGGIAFMLSPRGYGSVDAVVSSLGGRATLHLLIYP